MKQQQIIQQNSRRNIAFVIFGIIVIGLVIALIFILPNSGTEEKNFKARLGLSNMLSIYTPGLKPESYNITFSSMDLVFSKEEINLIPDNIDHEYYLKYTGYLEYVRFNVNFLGYGQYQYSFESLAQEEDYLAEIRDSGGDKVRLNITNMTIIIKNIDISLTTSILAGKIYLTGLNSYRIEASILMSGIWNDFTFLYHYIDPDVVYGYI